MVFTSLFIILSIPVCCIINQKKALYQAEAEVAFIGQSRFFNAGAEAKKIKEADFLLKVLEEIPQLDFSTLRDNLNLRFEKENILVASFISTDPGLAKDIVNTLSSLFLEERSNIIKSLDREAKTRLKKIEKDTGILRYNLNLSRTKLKELRQKNAEVDKKRADLLSRLSGLEMQREELLRIFTEKHPEVIDVIDRIGSIRSGLDQLPDNTSIYNKLTTEVEEWDSVLSSKQREEEDLKASFKENGQVWRAELVKEAELPLGPIGRPKSWYYTWGLLAVFAVSLLSCIIVEMVDRRIYIREEIPQYLKLPLIAEIDKVSFKNLKKEFRGLPPREKALFNYLGNPQLLTKYERLYTFLKLEIFKGNIEKKTVLITSAEPGTGKTFTACSLALAIAKSGERVLLVDANFRRPAVNLFFGFSEKEKGVSDLLRGSLNHKDVVKNLTDLLLIGSLKLGEQELVGLDNLRILLSGTKVENPLGLLESKGLSDLFRQLSQSYGLLIVDTHSLRGYADAFNIIPSADALLLIARKARTTYPLLREAASQLAKIEEPLTAGVVLNYV